MTRAELVASVVADLEPELNPSGDADIRAFITKWVRRRGMRRALDALGD